MSKNAKTVEDNKTEFKVDTSKLETALTTHRPEIISVMAGKYKNASSQLVKDLLDAIELPSEFGSTLKMIQEADSYKKRIVKPRAKKEKPSQTHA